MQVGVHMVCMCGSLCRRLFDGGGGGVEVYVYYTNACEYVCVLSSPLKCCVSCASTHLSRDQKAVCTGCQCSNACVGVHSKDFLMGKGGGGGG